MTSPTSTAKSHYQMSKLTEIQNELKAKKSCYNKFGKYHYRKCEDILEALKPLLKKHDVDLIITDEVKSTGDYTYIDASVCLYDQGKLLYASDAQAGIEKAGGMALPQAFGAASSYARKYALGAMFLLDDTEDADATNDHKEPKAIEVIESLPSIESVKDLELTWKGLSAKLKADGDVKKAFTARKAELN